MSAADPPAALYYESTVTWKRLPVFGLKCTNCRMSQAFVAMDYVTLVLAPSGELVERRADHTNVIICAECLGRKLAFHFAEGSAASNA